MITLTILNSDGSVYWVEHFISVEQATLWIEEEQTRSYWDSTRTYTIVDDTPAVQSPSALELCHQNRLAAYPPVADYLDGFAKSTSSDAAEAAQGVAQMAEYAAACLAVKARFPKP